MPELVVTTRLPTAAQNDGEVHDTDRRSMLLKVAPVGSGSVKVVGADHDLPSKMLSDAASVGGVAVWYPTATQNEALVHEIACGSLPGMATGAAHEPPV